MHELIESDPDVEVIWRAYELRPEPVPMIDPNSEYLRRVWRDSVAPMAERLGVKMNFPPVKPRTRLAHEAAHWARAQNRFKDYHDEIFRAFFERGEDIGGVDVLISLAAELELENDSLRETLTSHEFSSECPRRGRRGGPFGREWRAGVCRQPQSGPEWRAARGESQEVD